jgi:hypothetical protein
VVAGSSQNKSTESGIHLLTRHGGKGKGHSSKSAKKSLSGKGYKSSKRSSSKKAKKASSYDPGSISMPVSISSLPSDSQNSSFDGGEYRKAINFLEQNLIQLTSE